jgi:hypothetical protein
MRALSLTLLFAALLVQTGIARAASVDFAASELRGNSVVVTDLGPGLLAIDPAFVSDAPIDLIIVLGAEDMGAPLAWNALVDNLTGEVWQAFTVEVFGATSMHVGSAVANAGAIAWIDATWATATLRFDPAEAAGIDLGAPFGVGEDWRVDLGGLDSTSFRLRFAPLAVPESSTLLAIGGGLVALARIRRRAGGCVQH